MRDLTHYLTLFSESEDVTVGDQLVARAVASVTGGDVRTITRELPETLTAGEACRELLDAALSTDPIPPDALRAALEHLTESGILDAGHGRRGQTWLAGAVSVDPSTVRRWVSGSSACTGASATAVRGVILGVLE